MTYGNATSWVGLLALVVHVVDRLVGQWLASRSPAPTDATASALRALALAHAVHLDEEARDRPPAP